MTDERNNDKTPADPAQVPAGPVDPPPYVPPSLRQAERHRQARVGQAAGQSPAPRRVDLAYDVDNIYTYHPPIGDQAQRYGELRASAKGHAELIIKLVPASAERTLALRRLEECVMWANAAIARNEGQVRDAEGE